MHNGNDFDGFGTDPVDHAIGKVRHSAFAQISLYLAIDEWVALKPVQGLFQAVQKVLCQAGSFVFVEGGGRIRLGPGLFMPAQPH